MGTEGLFNPETWYSKGKYYKKYSDPQEKTSYGESKLMMNWIS
jgi:hypothetical protein